MLMEILCLCRFETAIQKNNFFAADFNDHQHLNKFKNTTAMLNGSG